MDEPQQVQDYWGLVSRVGYHSAPSDRPAGRADVAAVITVEHLELLPELLAQQEAERLRSIGRR